MRTHHNLTIYNKHYYIIIIIWWRPLVLVIGTYSGSINKAWWQWWQVPVDIRYSIPLLHFISSFTSFSASKLVRLSTLLTDGLSCHHEVWWEESGHCVYWWFYSVTVSILRHQALECVCLRFLGQCVCILHVDCRYWQLLLTIAAPGFLSSILFVF